MFKHCHIITILFFLFSYNTAIAGEIIIENAWVREAPPVSRIQAAYAIVKNGLNNDIQLINASSPAFKKIEFHETVIENGLSKMRHLTFITIPKNSYATFKPEGMHMMLFNPLKPLHAGEKINITFMFSNDTIITTSFIVKKSTNINSHQHMHH